MLVSYMPRHVALAISSCVLSMTHRTRGGTWRDVRCRRRACRGRSCGQATGRWAEAGRVVRCASITVSFVSSQDESAYIDIRLACGSWRPRYGPGVLRRTSILICFSSEQSNRSTGSPSHVLCKSCARSGRRLRLDSPCCAALYAYRELEASEIPEYEVLNRFDTSDRLAHDGAETSLPGATIAAMSDLLRMLDIKIRSFICSDTFESTFGCAKSLIVGCTPAPECPV
jgi:hypothetical protein